MSTTLLTNLAETGKHIFMCVCYGCLYVCAASIRYMCTGSYVFPCPSKAEIMYKYKVLNVKFSSELYALSNGGLGFLASRVYAENES